MNDLQNIGMIRRRLGHPLPDGPDDQQLLQLLVDQLLHHHAQLVNTRNHWAVDKWTLNTSSGVEDYIVAAGNFGRPFLVYTVDDTNPYHVRREVPISLLQDADRRYVGPKQTDSALAHTSVEVCFYRRQGLGWYVRTVPVPSMSSSYEIWFESNYEYTAPSEAPGLESFHHLVRVQAAIGALPFCRWRDMSPTQNPQGWQMQMAALRDSLLHDEQKFQKEFDSYKAMSSREGVNNKIGYAPGYETDMFGAGRMVQGYGY